MLAGVEPGELRTGGFPLQTETFLFIRSELEPQNVSEACAACAGQIAQMSPLLIEFDRPGANVFALQLAISCKHSLESHGAFLGFGPIAQRELGRLLKDKLPDPNKPMPVGEPA